MKNDNIKKNQEILVFYISVKNIEPINIADYMRESYETICPKTFKGEVIFLPTNLDESRVEMINPVYITDKNLILKHELMMEELNNNIKNQINLQ